MGSAIEPVGDTQDKRRYRTVEEKRLIVEETLVKGASVSVVARRRGVNANQVFYWRKLYQSGQLGSSPDRPVTDVARLLPVTIVNEPEPAEEQSISAVPSSGAIHIEIPGRALVSVEGSADATLVRAVLESLRR